MRLPRFSEHGKRHALRIALSHYVANGLSAALGLLLISSTIHMLLGTFASIVASVGVVVCVPPDQPAPKRGKFWQLLPAALLGLPLFFGVQVLHASPLLLSLLLVPATFIAFLMGAWGKQGLPISMSVMFAVVFSMAVPERGNSVSTLTTCAYFALGSVLYLIWATLANAALNTRYRVQMLADVLLSLAKLMRTEALQFAPALSPLPVTPRSYSSELLGQQATLANQLQEARDILLESPSTERRQQLADMLTRVLEIRDHLLVSELDLDTLKSHAGSEPALNTLREVIESLANEVEQLADDMLRGRTPMLFESHRAKLTGLRWSDAPLTPAADASPSPAMLALGLASRIEHLNNEVLRLIRIERREIPPDVDLVRTNWQLFVSPTTWSWQPLLAMWNRDAPPLRHAIRATLAIGTAYALGLALPWGTHDYWILITIVVVLRGSLAQTLERRNSRIIGTAVGCLVAGLLLLGHMPPWALMMAMTLAQAIAHSFVLRRYLVTAIAATVLGLLQVHLLHAESSVSFDVIERLADTLIGVTIAWVFSYVLPSWEREQIPKLITRTLAAQTRHAHVALGLWQLQAVDNEPELRWRLARREVYDSLSALVQATQRSLAEPRAVRPPVEHLERFLTHSYLLLAQLTTVKTLLLQRRGQLTPEQVRAPLQHSAKFIESALATTALADTPFFTGSGAHTSTESPLLNDPFSSDLSPWLLRRLTLAQQAALQLRQDADHVLGSSAFARSVA